MYKDFPYDLPHTLRLTAFPQLFFPCPYFSAFRFIHDDCDEVTTCAVYDTSQPLMTAAKCTECATPQHIEGGLEYAVLLLHLPFFSSFSLAPFITSLSITRTFFFPLAPTDNFLFSFFSSSGFPSKRPIDHGSPLSLYTSFIHMRLSPTFSLAARDLGYVFPPFWLQRHRITMQFRIPRTPPMFPFPPPLVFFIASARADTNRLFPSLFYLYQ